MVLSTESLLMSLSDDSDGKDYVHCCKMLSSLGQIALQWIFACLWYPCRLRPKGSERSLA